MKKTILNLIASLFITTIVYGQDWQTIKTFMPSQTLKDIVFVDATTAYAVSALYNGTAVHVKKTIDGGLTWEEQYTGHVSTSFKRIATPNNGNDVFVVGGAGILIHTNDGGSTWNTINIGIGTTQLRDIFFFSNSIGYIAADNATILKTTDGGITWTNLNANMTGVNTIGRINFLT